MNQDRGTIMRHAYQAIRTRYIGPRGKTGGRVIATSDGHRTVVEYNHALSADENHAAACRAHCARMGWKGTYAMGWLNDLLGWVWVSVESAEDRRILIQVE